MEHLVGTQAFTDALVEEDDNEVFHAVEEDRAAFDALIVVLRRTYRDMSWTAIMGEDGHVFFTFSTPWGIDSYIIQRTPGHATRWEMYRLPDETTLVFGPSARLVAEGAMARFCARAG